MAQRSLRGRGSAIVRYQTQQSLLYFQVVVVVLVLFSRQDFLSIAEPCAPPPPTVIATVY